MFAHRIDEEEKCSNYLRCNVRVSWIERSIVPQPVSNA